jgi:hypothetical protein
MKQKVAVGNIHLTDTPYSHSDFGCDAGAPA